MESQTEISPLRHAIRDASRVEVDLGCGKGTFLTSLAKSHPDTHFVGIEHQAGRVEKSNKKAVREGLENVHFVFGEILEMLHAVFPPASVDVLHLLFSDPWPKRRHHHLRVLNPLFLTAALRVLKPGGRLRFMTDDAPYFEAGSALLSADRRFQIVPDDGREYPRTDFQVIFEAQGKLVQCMVVEKL